MKKYLFVTVKRKDGFEYPNPLMLKESHIINKILQLPEVESVNVVLSECTKEEYNRMFGA